MTSRARTWILVFAVIGLAAAATATYVHYRLLTDPTYTSFCDINQTVNCETAYKSRYGSIAGVSVAVLGTLWFLLVAGLAVAWRPAPAVPASMAVPSGKGKTRGQPAVGPEPASGIPGYLFVMATIGLAVILYLAYAAFFVLKALCVLCLFTYASVIAIFLISGAATPFGLATLPSRLGGDVGRLMRSRLALALTVVYLAVAVLALAYFPREGVAAAENMAMAPAASADTIQADQRSEFERWMDTQTRVPVAVPSDGAKVLIVKFNDFQCPPCRQSHVEYKGILAKYEASGDVQFILKHFPLDPECNAAAPGGQHFAACEAAAAVVMARSKGTVPKLEDWFFDNQPALNPQVVRTAARDVGGVTDFDSQYQRALQEVKADAGLGVMLGVQSTPTFFINGHRIRGMMPPRAFDAAIKLEIARAKSRTK